MRFNIFVVIVTYGNRFNLLKQVIDAVLDEHVNRIIVVDNNSQTESRNNLKKYQEKYSNILKVFYQYKNTGSAAGFKFGIKEAYNSKECDFILLLDDDNVVMKNCITNFINLYDIYSKIFNNKIALMMYRKYSYFDDYLCCSSKILKNNYYR